MAKSRDCVIGWLATLDFRTCPQCKSLDGVRWEKGQKHPTPPLHPGCRCVLIPVTELTDLGEDVPRPMANADFDALAKEAYEKKYPAKKWDNLSPSTKKRYYYQAQKDFEHRTGKPAYSFVRRNKISNDYEYKKKENIKSYTPNKYILYNQPRADYKYYAKQKNLLQKQEEVKREEVKREEVKQEEIKREETKSIFRKILDFLIRNW